MEDAAVMAALVGLAMGLVEISKGLIAKIRGGGGPSSDASENRLGAKIDRADERLSELAVAAVRDHTQLAMLLQNIATQLADIRAEGRATAEALKSLTKAIESLNERLAHLEQRVGELEAS